MTPRTAWRQESTSERKERKKYLTLTELRIMPTEKLYEVSMQKNKKGIATRDARTAQMVLWQRAGCPFSSSAHWMRDHTGVRKI